MPQYSIYGLTIATDHPVDGLLVSPDSRTPDLKVHFQMMPSWATSETWGGPTKIMYVSREITTDGTPLLTVHELKAGAFLLFRYVDGTVFLLDRMGTEVWCTWPAELSFEDTLTYLLGPILGFILRLKGTTCLHASGVVIDGSCAAIVGPAGAGKSTLAAAFAQCDYSIVSDDVLPLTRDAHGYVAHPGYPRLRLWPESVKMLYGNPTALPLLTPNWDKRYLDLTGNGYTFVQNPHPLSGIYVLQARKEGIGHPLLELLPPQEALIQLVSHTYMNKLLPRNNRIQEFEFLSRLVETVPVWKLTPDADHKNLALLIDALVRNTNRLPAHP
jgi:hypothetical protein